MPSSIATLAEAVKTALNTAVTAETFSATFTARRVYVPLRTLPALTTLNVHVYASANEINLATRAGVLRDVPIEIGINKKIAGDPTLEAANVEIDALMLLVEEIVEFFALPGTGYGDAKLTAKANAPIYDTERLLGKEFLSVVSLTFKM